MSSTPDTVFASHNLANAVICYNTHIVDYSSNHKGIVLETSTILDNYKEREKKRLYFEAD
jgi:hypothetical protein